jgi:hypothetical protein
MMNLSDMRLLIQELGLVEYSTNTGAVGQPFEQGHRWLEKGKNRFLRPMEGRNRRLLSRAIKTLKA